MKRDGFFELNAVLAVADANNFRIAARELDISPSGLSHAIGALEKRLGVRLFHRTTRSVALSQAGEAFVARIRPALGELNGALENINDHRDTPRGTLRINTSEPWARQLFQSVVIEFLRRYPEMKVELACDSRFVDIVKEGFDAGVRIRDEVPADMVAVPCTPPHRNIVVATPAFVRKHGKPTSPSDLLDFDCVVVRRGLRGRYHWEFERNHRRQEVDVKGRIAVDTISLLIDAALAGLGFAYVGEPEVTNLLRQKRLVTVLESWSPTWEPLAIYYPSHRHVPAGLRAFVELAREQLKAHRRARPAALP